MARLSVIIIDDEAEIREVLTRALTQWGYEVSAAAAGAKALDLLAQAVFDVALLDISMPGMNGLDVFQEIRRRDLGVDVVMVTGRPTMATAVEALRLGAYDYLEKPLDFDALRHLLDRLVERRFLRGEVTELRKRLAERPPVTDLVAVSPAMHRLKAMLEQVAASDSPVLVEGESGTGKELVATEIHRLSPRGARPFVAVNCGAIPENLMESQFFGHVRGAFSGASAGATGLFRAAHRGSLFLDEVGELSTSLQVKLLRALQEKEVRPVGAVKSERVDVRVIAATNRNVDEAVEAGHFRQDLFYRLSVIRIPIPPLRERTEDIPALVTHFLRQLNQRFGRQVRRITPEALAALGGYDFPGNIRELENLLERAYALGAQGELTIDDLPALRVPSSRSVTSKTLPTLAEAERDLILRALRLHRHNRDEVARSLGISLRTLYRRLREYDLGEP